MNPVPASVRDSVISCRHCLGCAMEIVTHGGGQGPVKHSAQSGSVGLDSGN